MYICIVYIFVINFFTRSVAATDLMNLLCYFIYIMSIFIKKKENDDITYTTILKEDVLENIPKGATNKKDKDLELTSTEYRWRMIRLPNSEKEFIEISYKQPNQKRLFMNHGQKWIEYEKDSQFDQYVIKEYYFYVENTKS